MKTISKIVENAWFNHFMNFITVVSVGFIFVEKFVDLDLLTYEIIYNIDLAILILFSLDFILRLIAGGKKYFFNDFGWIDFLAALPILSPAIKGFRVFRLTRAFRLVRIVRILRMLRFLRMLRMLKFATSGFSEVKQNFMMSIASAIMLVMIAGAVLLIEDRARRLEAHDIEAETHLIRTAFQGRNIPAARAFMRGQPRVLDIIDLDKLRLNHRLAKLEFRRGDTYVKRLGGFYVVFSRRHSRRSMELFEGWLMVGIFLATLLLLLVTHRRMDSVILPRIRRTNQALRQALGEPPPDEADGKVDDFQVMEELAGKLSGKNG